MGIKKSKPITAGRRDSAVDDFSDITTDSPYKSLLAPLTKKGGRNNKGRITVRHRGGGHKRRYRMLDFIRSKEGKATVESIEYDPNRSSRISLIRFNDGTKKYILTPNNVSLGDVIETGDSAENTLGNTKSLGSLQTGTLVHNVELSPGKGGIMVKSAGTAAQVMAHEGGYTLLRLPSGEMRRILSKCNATIGQVSNPDNKNKKLGRAGTSRRLGRRPSVRGSAMSPNAHPHGGGEGRAGVGMVHPKTPWGKPALGKRTRRNKKTDKMILRRRYEK
ncbi:MAG: 50S ribosomal protein L2 [Dehalococcoidales bacterium]|nr:50S ribosomal protein L2 [Dehalococcoidia bacterium]NCG35813.1 50S ribosomal protein L2 [Dehalococcoidales bacterium]